MKGGIRSRALFILGLMFSIVPPLWATLSYFPLWAEQSSGKIISGLLLLLLILCFVPLIRVIKRFLRSPSAFILWLIVFAIFYCMSKIADQVTVISFFGFLGNLIGAILFKLARRSGGRP